MKNAMTKTALNYLMTSAALLAALTACTKARTPDINDDETKSQIFAISDLQGQQYNLQTGKTLSAMDTQNDLHALAEKPQVSIDSSNAPARLQGIFKSLPVSAQSGKTYSVRLSVDSKTVTLFRIVSDSKDLTDLDKTSMIQQTVTVGKDKKQISLVPMAQMAVKDYGTLCRIKNDSGDTTSNLKICHTDFSQATHVQISLKADDLKAALDQHEMDQVFMKDRLNGHVTTVSALQQEMKFSLYPLSDEKVVTYTRPMNGSEVDLMVYKVTSKSKITDEKLLQKLNSNVKTGLISYCPQNILASLSADEQKDCVLVLAYQMKGDGVRAETQTTDDLGRPGISVKLNKTAASTAQLIKFEEAIPVETVNPANVTALNPYNTIRISDVMNKEFMMRRTFEDAASTLTGFGPGASGYMDLVKFELTDTAVVVRRLTTVNGAKDATNIDKEEVMSIPVTYLKVDPVTANSVAPNLITATKLDAQYAQLDWTANTISSTNSPLSYANDGPESCFSSTSRQEVTDLDNRIQDGVLSFSIEGSYTFKPRCSTFVALNDYWYGGGNQSNFNIKERVSFMLNKGTQDNNPGLSVPFRAQNLLGYGVFTMDQIQTDQYGNRGTIGTENPLPVIYDFSNGKQLVYHLGGLPDDKSSWVYQALVDGTKEVVADWNQALHRAFVGTALARSGDYIVLKVDGIDDVPGHLGDLDRSYIWNFTKNMDSGLLGLSQAAPNPRSGRIEQNNVLMYSGNLVAELGYIRNSVRKQVAYNQWKDKVFQGVIAKAAPLAGAENSNAPTGDANSGLDVDNGDSGSAPDSSSGTGTSSNSMKTTFQNLKSLGIMQIPTNFSKKAMKANLHLQNRSMKSSLKTMKSIADSSRLKSSILMTKDLQARNSDLLSNDRTHILEKVVREAARQGITRDSQAMMALLDTEILKSDSLTKEQQQNAVNEARRLLLTSHFNKNFNKGPNCITSGEDFMTSMTADKDLLDDSKTADVFKRWYKATLAHEMGHSLGLTHNFEGSVDKPNFLFADEKAGDGARNYSSIMDYIPDQYQSYAGPGPYDVRALRVAYTGMIELSLSLKDSIKDNKLISRDGSVSIPVTKASDDFFYEISLADYQKLELSQSNLWRADTSVLKHLPIKTYRYCTDKDVGYDPMCNRWDTGTTERDIAKFYVNQYKDGYATYNTRGDDLMNMPSKSRYIVNHLLMNYFGIRPFMEETFYRAGIKRDEYTDDQVNAAFGAGLEGLEFFLQVASAPTKDLSYNSEDRIQLYQYDGEKGKENYLVELKSMEDKQILGSDTELDTRGIEEDRILALEFLTAGGLGGPRYDIYEMGPNYESFEQGMMGKDANSSFVFRLMTGLFSENTPPYLAVEDGSYMITLPQPDFKSESTLDLRQRAALDAVVFMESSNPSDLGNYAAAFRVGSGQNSTPKDRFVVAKAAESMTSIASQKYWAMDNATVANNVVRTAAQVARYRDNTQKLGDELLKLYNLAKTKSDAATSSKNLQDKKPTITGDLQKDLQNSMSDAVAAGTAKAAATNSASQFQDQANLVIADLVAMNADRLFYTDVTIANVQAYMKKMSGADISADDAQKILFQDDVNSVLNKMAMMENIANSVLGLTDDQLNNPDTKKSISDFRNMGYEAVKQTPLLGVAQDAMANDKTMMSIDAHLNVVNKGDLTAAISKITFQHNLDSYYTEISGNLETMNRWLMRVHPELNRY